ncbi:MAG: SCO family protein [Alphaproteobacteria bacterium]|nr:SCO family protein [Pseudomonadota bacterium]TDI65516.1 MAG: SCO family protein [Alphaproteobacteria bacterium]
MNRRQIVIFSAGILACVLVAWALAFLVKGRRATMPIRGPVIMLTAAADIGGPFRLTDHTGKRVTDADFRGRFMLLYFGYTFCPDVCPADLQTMGRALDILAAKGEVITPVFITVDPERDSPAVLKKYVAAFHPRMVGLTGPAAAIKAAAKAYKVYYRAQPGAKPGDTKILMDHTSFIYLVGPDGKAVAAFRGGTRPEVLAKELARLTG